MIISGKNQMTIFYEHMPHWLLDDVTSSPIHSNMPALSFALYELFMQLRMGVMHIGMMENMQQILAVCSPKTDVHCIPAQLVMEHITDAHATSTRPHSYSCILVNCMLRHIAGVLGKSAGMF